MDLLKTELKRPMRAAVAQRCESTTSSFISAGQLFQPHRRTSGGGLEWEVESKTVTHSSAD